MKSTGANANIIETNSSEVDISPISYTEIVAGQKKDSGLFFLFPATPQQIDDINIGYSGWIVFDDVAGIWKENDKISKISNPTVNDIAKLNSDGQIENSGVQVSDIELNSNKVTAFQSTPNDDKYPSEKLVKDNLDLKINTSDIIDNLASTDINKPLSANQGKELEDNKANKITGGVDGNIVTRDANGDNQDSGNSIADVLDRTNHTGTQAISTIADLQIELDDKADKVKAGTAGNLCELDPTGNIIDGGRVIDKLLTGFLAHASVVVITATDSILTAFQKAQKYFNEYLTSFNVANKLLKLNTSGYIPPNLLTPTAFAAAFITDRITSATNDLPLTGSNIVNQSNEFTFSSSSVTVSKAGKYFAYLTTFIVQPSVVSVKLDLKVNGNVKGHSRFDAAANAGTNAFYAHANIFCVLDLNVNDVITVSKDNTENWKGFSLIIIENR